MQPHHLSDRCASGLYFGRSGVGFFVCYPFIAMESKNTTTKPEKVFSRRGIVVSVFRYKNEIEDRTISNFKMTVRRLYKDDEEKTQSTYFLAPDDWPMAEFLSRQAWQYMMEQSQSDESAEANKKDKS